MIKESQLKELIGLLVKEVLLEYDMIPTAMPTSTASTNTIPKTSAEAERELYKQEKEKKKNIKAIDFQLKQSNKERKAGDERWKVEKRGLEMKKNMMKRPGVPSPQV